jgi:predicted GIY-YIG superfamily endonuclease
MEIIVILVVIVFVYIFIIGPAQDATKKMRHSSRKYNKSKGPIYIYRLMDGNKPFYVGQTVQKPENRLRQHMNDVSGNDKSWYIHNKMGWRREPRIEVIDKAWSQEQANRLENRYMRKWGLTNMKRA